MPRAAEVRCGANRKGFEAWLWGMHTPKVDESPDTGVRVTRPFTYGVIDTRRRAQRTKCRLFLSTDIDQPS